MAEIKKDIVVKLQITGAKATPAPPVGQVLGQYGINLSDFCTRFNAATQKMAGDVVPTIITIKPDRSFSFVLKSPPATELIKKAIGLGSGSGEPNKKKVGKLTDAQLTEIAKRKMTDLNAHDIEQAKRIIAGSARSMGVTIEK